MGIGLDSHQMLLTINVLHKNKRKYKVFSRVIDYAV